MFTVTAQLCACVVSTVSFRVSSPEFEGGKISELTSNSSSSQYYHIIIGNDYFYIISLFFSWRFLLFRLVKIIFPEKVFLTYRVRNFLHLS